MVAVVECLHHDPVRLCCQLGDLTGFGGIGGERLFAQHVFTGGQCGPGPSAVQTVRQRVVDRVQVRVGDQFVVVVVYPGDVVFGGKGPTTRHIAGRHRGHHDFGVFLRGVDERQRGDARRTENADPQRRPLSRHGADASTSTEPSLVLLENRYGVQDYAAFLDVAVP